jgi:Flp pilus assembly protein TadD
MLNTEAFREFKEGLDKLRDSDPHQALAHMRRAVELEAHNPFYLSYLGLLLARTERKWGEAEELCTNALKLKRDPQLYLNLAQVYVAADRRDDAVETLLHGMKSANRDIRLKLLLSKLVVRRRPVLPFLARDHSLNRHLGKLRHRVLKVLRVA